MQLSEVIARTRRYFKEVTGSSEHIVAENVTPSAIAHKLEYLNIKTDSEEVKKWLENMDYDRKGLVYINSFSLFVFQKLFWYVLILIYVHSAMNNYKIALINEDLP